MTSIIEAPEAVGMSAPRLAHIRPVLQAYIDHGQYAGISVVIARRGQIVCAEHLGWRDKEAGLPMDAATIFRIYSMTKPIICVALMMLYEEGRFQLLTPVAKLIPAFRKARVLASDGRLNKLIRPLTIRDLLAHIGGLTYDFLEDSPVSELYRQARLMNDSSRSLEALVHEVARLPLAFQPGTRWNYSVGIDVVAHLIQILADQPLGDFLYERIFAPLGMVDTAFGVPAAQRERLAAMYGLPDLIGAGQTLSGLITVWMQGFNQRIDVDATYPASTPTVFMRGGLGLFSTAGDYLRFAQMLLNGGQLDGARLLGRKTLELMHMNHLPSTLLPYEIGGVPLTGYGFGLGSRVLLNVAESALPGSIGEFGWSGAAKTYYWVDPQEELIGLFMTQHMVGMDMPEQDLRVLAYQAIVD